MVGEQVIGGENLDMFATAHFAGGAALQEATALGFYGVESMGGPIGLPQATVDSPQTAGGAVSKASPGGRPTGGARPKPKF